MLPAGALLRAARFEDREALKVLIEASVRQLGARDYSLPQLEGALRGAFGVDSQLIIDQTYFVVERDTRLIACGGWSRRRTLFGGDARSDRDPAELDPLADAAKIRAFFVAPEFARTGLGSLLLEHCEHEARLHGFTRFELMATLPGVRLYARRGYVAGEKARWPLGEGVSIEFVPMTKHIAAT